MEDEKIIALYWKRSQSAIKETKRKYEKYCFKIAFGMLRNQEDVKECINDAYFAAWNTIPPAKPKRLELFLGKIVRCIAIDMLRKQNADKRGGKETVLILEELEECICAKENVEKVIEQKELTKSINRFLYTLKEENRNIFIRRYWYMNSVKEIAGWYGVKESKVKSSLLRTRRKLLEYLKKEEALG